MKRLLVPVVEQTTAASSGAASLSSICRGFGITVSEPDIVTACAGTASGICIDDLEVEANRRGLKCQQLIVPVEHLLQSNRHLPAIAVTRSSNGTLGSMVLWHQIGGIVQAMDPQFGRRWIRKGVVAGWLYRHTQRVSAKALSDWMRTASFQGPLESRIKRLRIADAHTLIANAACEPGWRGMATLDAAVRQIASQAGVRRRPGHENRLLVLADWKAALEMPERIPQEFWFAKNERRHPDTESGSASICGAVVLCIGPPGS